MWPDYEKEPLQIWNDPVFEVYDPWTAQVIGLFYNREDAEFFAKTYTEQAAENQKVE